ncbi:hypothetical protein B0H19DRAFT_1075659 [Mycena capillaripes]|nr:hypothetical protein B0H19DRAFT_1075659 [Mycena capillaripes]
MVALYRLIHTFIRAQNHESWDGGAGHTAGNVAGFISNLSEKIRCRRCHLKCNGIDTCEFFEEEILDGLERYEADEIGDARTLGPCIGPKRGRSSVSSRNNMSVGTLATPHLTSQSLIYLFSFYVRIMKSKCKTPSTHGKRFFVGCSDWKRPEQHIPIPVIARLKSILGLETQIEIDVWHKLVAAQEDIEIQRWYAQKLTHPWLLPCINKYLSDISSDSRDNYGNGGQNSSSFPAHDFNLNEFKSQLVVQISWRTDMSTLFDNSWDSDAFLAGVNPSMLDFGFMLDTTVVTPLLIEKATMASDISGILTHLRHGSMQPQELPPLPASYPSHDEPDDRDADAASDDDHPVAPQDIDLELNERKILVGKRKRTKSTRAVDGTAAGPSKKISRHGPVKMWTVLVKFNWKFNSSD